MERFSAVSASQSVQIDLLCTLVAFTGVYIPYTYISVVYAPVTGAQPQWRCDAADLRCCRHRRQSARQDNSRIVSGPVPVIVGGSLGLAIVFLLVPLLNSTLPSGRWSSWRCPVCSHSALTTPQRHLPISDSSEAASCRWSRACIRSAIYAAVSLSGVVGALAIRWGAADRLTLVAVVPDRSRCLDDVATRRQVILMKSP